MRVYVCGFYNFSVCVSMWYIMYRCVCVCVTSLWCFYCRLLQQFCYHFVVFCCLLSFVVVVVASFVVFLLRGFCWFLADWASAQLCSVQFSSAQPFSPLLSSYFLFIFCRVFFARFHFYLPLSWCVCVCRLASDWTHHTRARTPAFTCDTHTDTDTHTRRQAHGHSVGSTHRTARFGRFIYIVYVWYISIPYPRPLPHSAPTLALSAYTMVMCVGVCWQKWACVWFEGAPIEQINRFHFGFQLFQLLPLLLLLLFAVAVVVVV